MNIKEKWLLEAKVDKNQYTKMYEESLINNESFWSKHGSRIDWIKKYTKVKDIKYSKSDVHVNGFMMEH